MAFPVTPQQKISILDSLAEDAKSLVMQLKDQQQQAFFEIVQWARMPMFGGTPGYILKGYAGTGKTFLTKVLAKVLGNVVLTATTNKAVKELRKQNPNTPSMTIYSLLGLRMEAHEDTMRLVKGSGPSTANKYRYIILDEAGMTPSVLIMYLEMAMRAGIKILFIGDKRQLNPVGERSSLIWEMFDSSELTKVLRHDNQILKFATHIRKTRLADIKLLSDNDKKEGVWKLNYGEFVQKIQKYAKQGKFDGDGTTKAVAWRNSTVDSLNDVIRKCLYGEKVFESRFLVDDRIVFTSPYEVDKYNSIYTDDEARVVRVETAPHVDTGLLCYYLTVECEGRQFVVPSIHENSEAEFQANLATLAQDARKNKSRELWGQFWELKNSISYLKYGHALTTHRAQGSTYKYCFVAVSDILQNSDVNEARKCLYTASTRPTTRLFIY